MGKSHPLTPYAKDWKDRTVVSTVCILSFSRKLSSSLNFLESSLNSSFFISIHKKSSGSTGEFFKGNEKEIGHLNRH